MKIFLNAILALWGSLIDATAADPDPQAILKKPIPDKLIVLTFDDACASGYTVAAPILKSLGFNASFYVCNFDSFKTRKDWYLTWRQMKELDEQGFEIGNHTVGHGGGLDRYLAMEDELYANNGPQMTKMTTVCWPLYGVVWNICPDLAKIGYGFGRGGHERPYRPTVDNPFDVPSYTIHDGFSVQRFIEKAKEACQGRVVVYCFHGVPDGEHPSVGLKPETFKVMMQYLKDNNYKCIAMRDMVEYMDPVKAATLPRTADKVKPEVPFITNKDDKPYVASAALDPQPRRAVKSAASTAKDILTFALPGEISVSMSGTMIGVYMPPAADVKTLAPTFTLSPLAVAVPASGAVRDFTKPQTYTISAQDGSTRTYTVAVVNSRKDASFTWIKAVPGNWSDGSKWSNGSREGTAPHAAGQADYILNFNQSGKYDITQDLEEGFMLNQLNLHVGQGNTLQVMGEGLRFTHDTAASLKPSINQYSSFSADMIKTPLHLASDVHVNLVAAGGRVTIAGQISGTGGLVCNGGNGNASGDLNGGPNQHFSTLSLTCVTNTYSGGTIINGGTLRLGVNSALGTGPVTLNEGAGFAPSHGNITNHMILNGGTIDTGGTNWNVPIILKGNTRIAGRNVNFNNVSGGMSGPGGFSVIGTWVAFGRGNDSELMLWGANTYTGPTIVLQGTLLVKKAVALYNADPTSWTPERISVHPAATLVISAGGPGEFTGAHVGALLKNLTASVSDNGLMARSTLCLDTGNANDPFVISANISDSNGSGGGAYVIKKCGAGTMLLSGKNTYTGQTILEEGGLSVSSFNSFAKGKGKPSSSLGTPTDIENGEIVMGREAKDGNCALIYTGPGETTDRVMNIAGRNETVTFDQSGNGLLKFTSTFVISGYGASKTINLAGDTAGSGEIAGNLFNPYDRSGKATTSVVKSGSGVWTLSGKNSYTGPTTVKQGTLSIATAQSLSERTEVSISEGAMLELNFNGETRSGNLYFDGKLQPSGTYNAENTPKYMKGKGSLKF